MPTLSGCSYALAMFVGAIQLIGCSHPVLAQGEGAVPVDQEISAEEVLRLVHAAHPGLEQFAAAMAAGDLAEAQELLVAHFANRQEPVVPPTRFPGVSEGNSMVMLPGSGMDRTIADEQWLRHVFTERNNDLGTLETYDLGAEINWLHTPSAAFSWGLYLNQLNIISKLAGVYRDTRDEKYAMEIGNLVVGWTRQVPRGYGYTRAGELVNSGMEVRNRLCNAIAAYDAVRAAPSLTPETHMAFWKLFITACRELMTYSGVSYPGLIPAAVMFPEFTEADQWLTAGMVDIHHQLVDRTTPEGAWDTHSVSYQTVPVPWAARSLEFLQANDPGGRHDELAAMIDRQAGKLLEMMLRITMPNGGLPNIGDTYGRSDWNAAAFLPSLQPWMALKLDAEERARLEAITDPFARLKAALAIADGRAGDEPALSSMAMPGTGYYVMRSGWNADSARYLYFDLSAQAMGHAHNDATHFELYAYGKPLLSDTGDYFLGWGYRTALHNAIEVDGQEQARGAVDMMPVEWLSTPGYDLVDGMHDAFASLGVSQRRRIVFVKPDYFVTYDLLGGEGTHRFEQFLHFAGPTQQLAAQVALDRNTLAATTLHDGTANVQVIPAITEGLSADFVQAQETAMLPEDKFERAAMLGWMVTGATFQRVKSPVVAYTREGNVPQAFCDVLFPSPAESDARVSVDTLPVSSGDRLLAATEAIGLVIDVVIDRPAHEPEEIVIDPGDNLALGQSAFVEVNAGAFPESGAARLTDGDTGARSIPAAVSSTPHQPGVALAGRFGIEFARPTELNCVFLHHGTWNGSAVLYPPEEMNVQYRADGAWHDVTGPMVTWGDDFVAEVHFEPVTTDAISVAVQRPSGGRLSMREFQAYRVAGDELARIAALREERTTERWTDTLLMAQAGVGQRSYGEYSFDGEMALIRTDEDGRIARVVIHRGCELRRGGQTLVAGDEVIDTLTATWPGGSVQLDCVGLTDLSLIAQDATAIVADGQQIPARVDDGLLRTERAEAPTPLEISGLRVELHPPQEGLAGGQPWAMVSWRTDRPATTQVEFSASGGPVRRTTLDRALVTEHAARVEFLRPDEPVEFRAVSVDIAGRRAVGQT